jgi:CheY-like chemotaxis protein
LVTNAVKFTPEHGTIEIVAELEDVEDAMCRLRVEVRDTGIGLSEEQMDKLFTSFQQADSGTSRKYGGTGLGLVISKRIVELMGGTIGVTSKLGEGSTFAFVVPFEISEAYLTKAPDEDEANVQSDFSAFKVLLAEDIEINREIVVGLLEDSGIEILCAENGVEALDIFAERHDEIDLIFMDVQMPEMNGYEATERIRSMDVPEAAGIPIVAMSANVFREDIERCLAIGMNDHIGKPLDVRDLHAVLRKYLCAE